MGPRVKGIALGIPAGWLGGGIVARIVDNQLWPGFSGQLTLAFNGRARVFEGLVNLVIIIAAIVLVCRWLVGYFRGRAAAKAAPPPAAE